LHWDGDKEVRVPEDAKSARAAKLDTLWVGLDGRSTVAMLAGEDDAALFCELESQTGYDSAGI
jgi:hypothetical protein